MRKSKNHKISENESDNMSEKKEKQFNNNIKTSKSHSTKHQYNSKPIHKNKKCLVHDIDCSCECEKELCNMDLCLLGKKLIFSGAMLQENLGVFLVAESEKIEIAVDKFKKNHCASVTAEDLIKLNESVKDTICCLAKTEEEITQKIKMGEKFLHEKDPCPPHCHRHDEDNDDDDDD